MSTDLVRRLGVTNCSYHAHKTEFSYLLEILFKMSDDHPVNFIWESLPGFKHRKRRRISMFFFKCETGDFAKKR